MQQLGDGFHDQVVLAELLRTDQVVPQGQRRLAAEGCDSGKTQEFVVALLAQVDAGVTVGAQLLAEPEVPVLVVRIAADGPRGTESHDGLDGELDGTGHVAHGVECTDGDREAVGVDGDVDHSGQASDPLAEHLAVADGQRGEPVAQDVQVGVRVRR